MRFRTKVVLVRGTDSTRLELIDDQSSEDVASIEFGARDLALLLEMTTSRPWMMADGWLNDQSLVAQGVERRTKMIEMPTGWWGKLTIGWVPRQSECEALVADLREEGWWVDTRGLIDKASYKAVGRRYFAEVSVMRVVNHE